VVALIGKRETGKSFLIKDLLYHNKDIPIGIVISPTEPDNMFYESIVPKLFIHDKYKRTIVSNLIRRQKIIRGKINEEQYLCGKSNINPYAFLIFDDLRQDTSWIKDNPNLIKCLFLNGRQYKLVFIFKDNINRKRLYDHYGSMFPTFEMFCQVIDQCTDNFDCLVINNTIHSNKIEERVYWYHAEQHESFKLGAEQYW
jgi:hypothetical protein